MLAAIDKEITMTAIGDIVRLSVGPVLAPGKALLRFLKTLIPALLAALPVSGLANHVTPAQYFVESSALAYDACNQSASQRQAGSSALYNCFLSGNSWVLEEYIGGLGSHTNHLAIYYFPTSACPAGQTFQGPAPGSCQTGTGGGGGDPTGNVRDLGEPDCARGNPCNVATGNKFHSENDYSSPNARLEFIRAYNSQYPHDIGFGFGWTTSTNPRLELVGNSDDVIYWNRSGRGETFTCSVTTADRSTSPASLSARNVFERAGFRFVKTATNVAPDMPPPLMYCRGPVDQPLKLIKILALDKYSYAYELEFPDFSTQRFDSYGRILTDTDSGGRHVRALRFGCSGSKVRANVSMNRIARSFLITGTSTNP